MCSPSTRLTVVAPGLASAAFAGDAPRARDLGVPFDGTPEPARRSPMRPLRLPARRR
jgi:hypothetical protein